MDPLSITTGAAGLFSLMITVCQGLVVYCQGYQSREPTLAILEQHAESLHTMARNLEHLLRSPSDGLTGSTNLVDPIQKCLVACDTCIIDFKTIHKKYTTFPGPRASGKTIVRQLLYPFKKEEFESFRLQIREFHATLTSYLVLLNLDHTRELRQSTHLNHQNLSSTIIGHNQNLFAQISAIGPNITQTLENRLALLDSSIQKRLGEMEKGIMLALPANTQRDSSALCSRAADDNQKGRELSLTPMNSIFGFECSCDSVLHQHLRKPSRGPITHEKNCFFSFRNQSQHTMTGSLKLYRWLFQFTLQIRYFRWTARDLQVHPNFTIRATVIEKYSPAFGIIQRTFFFLKPDTTESELRDVFESSLRNLQCLFLEKRAWPTDIVANTGENLLHWAARGDRIGFNENTAPIFIQYLKSLISMGVPLNDAACDGTPLHCLMERALPSAQSMAREGDAPGVLPSMTKALIELGAELGNREDLTRWGCYSRFGNQNSVFPILPLLEHVDMGLYQSLGYGPLSCALLQKSEPAVCHLLESVNSLILEKGHRGETPIHLAILWPRGIELMLLLKAREVQAIVDTRDINGHTAFDYARMLGQAESAQLILDAGAGVDLNNTRVMETRHNMYYHQALSANVVSVLAQELARHRRQLTQFAIKHLTMREIDKFQLHKDYILQESAFEVVHFLKSRYIPLPLPFQTVLPGSIYHSVFMSDILAMALFDAGFDHVNVLLEGFTPVMTVDLADLSTRRSLKSAVDLVVWFEKRGIDLHAQIPVPSDNTATTIEAEHSPRFESIHKVANELGRGQSGYLKCSPHSGYINQLQRLITTEPSDPCDCHCARGGCTPVSLFAKGVWSSCYLVEIRAWPTIERMQTIQTYSPIFELLRKDLVTGLDVLELIVHGTASQDMAAAILRVSTFHRLGMKHTCCQYRRFSGGERSVTHAICDGEYQPVITMDAFDIEDIQEEDRHLAVVLDNLTEEFSLEFKQQNKSFKEFFMGYWWKRMDEIEREKEEISDLDLQAMRDIGVVWDNE